MAASVRYPIAKDANGGWVEITQAHRGGSYFCPECETSFVVRLGSIRVHHFAHKPGYQGVCSGESGYHNLAKHLLANHFEKMGSVPILSQCLTCAREFSEEKRITRVQVEKGNDDYRPDVRLILEGNISIDCEVVYKNPLGNKLNEYREKKANLLVWEIGEQIAEVPSLVQKFWEPIYERRYDYEKHAFRGKLFLLASPIPPEHTCSPYGVAYIFEVDCWKCRRKTKVAFLSSWYPMWGDLSKMGEVSGPVNYYTYVPFYMVPAGFWRTLNGRSGTRLSEDWSKTASQKYLMNHCNICSAKIGDFPLGEQLLDIFTENQDSIVRKVTIDFELTQWEKEAVHKNPLKRSAP